MPFQSNIHNHLRPKLFVTHKQNCRFKKYPLNLRSETFKYVIGKHKIKDFQLKKLKLTQDLKNERFQKSLIFLCSNPHRNSSTLIISMGWMTQVASMPEAPPLTNGFTVGQTPPDLGFSSPISSRHSKLNKPTRKRAFVKAGGEWQRQRL